MERLLKSRDEELKRVLRWEWSACKPMLYTPNLWTHIHRVEWNVKEICEDLLFSDTLVNEWRLIAKYHDDEEIVTWDVLTPEKDKWTQQERIDYETQCKQAKQILVKEYWSKLWDDYSRILTLLEIPKIEQPHEVQLLKAIVDYADKLDAHMEVTHEIYAGSIDFTKNLLVAHWYDDHVFWYTLWKIIQRKKHIETLLWKEVDTGLLDINSRWNIDIITLVNESIPHTLENLQKKTWDPIYDTWIQNHFKYWEIEHIEKLYIKNVTDKKD
jgi:5'-deoxynucleotidase YfbR-like HD superfamily hydrolase